MDLFERRIERHARSVLRICCGKAYVPARYPAELRKAPRVCDHTHTCLKIIKMLEELRRNYRATARRHSIAPGGLPYTPRREERRLLAARDEKPARALP